MNIGFVRSGVATVVATMALAGGAQAQNIVTNGGFEAPVVSDNCCITVTAGNSFPGWSVTAGDINVVRGSFNSGTGNRAFQGTQYVDLIGEANVLTTLSQTLNTVVGTLYTFSFAYSNNAFAGATARSATYSVGGLTGTVTHSSATPDNLDWNVFRGSFTATGSTTTLSFTERDGAGNAGVLLDDVSVVAVPEPATWAMMIAGFGLVGGVARRRRAVLATA